MSRDLPSVAFNALAAIVLLGATLAYVAPPPDETEASTAIGAAEAHSVPECSELDGVECVQESDDGYDEYEDREDDEDEDRSGKGNGKGKP